MSDITAQIILCLPDGSSPLMGDAPLEDNILQPNDKTFATAKSKLIELGFRVESSGALGWTVSADRHVYEQVFDIEFKQKVKSDGGILDWQPIHPIKIQDEFKSWLADILFSIQPEFVS